MSSGASAITRKVSLTVPNRSPDSRSFTTTVWSAMVALRRRPSTALPMSLMRSFTTYEATAMPTKATENMS